MEDTTKSALVSKAPIKDAANFSPDTFRVYNTL
jgi:hypothetical protein